jgi:processive rubber oxygenase RoxA-like protein
VTRAPRTGTAYAQRDIIIPTFDLKTIGTDPRQAETFERRKVTLAQIKGPAEIASSKAGEFVAGKIASQWIDESPANARRAAEINFGRGHEFRALLAYRARPLNGIWAMAPYLHNGSVPSLYQLLLPASQRSKVFYVGSWEFNPQTVGLEADNDFLGSFTFDTAKTGNSNAGHEYGTDLSDDDRKALIEYLKTL